VFTEPPALRLALAIGDQELEQRLRPALDAAPDLEVAAHCLAADQVLFVAQARQVDVVVLAWGLHRLSETVLTQLERTRLPILLLVPDAADERWLRRAATVLPLHVEPDVLREAVQAAARGERPLVARSSSQAAPAPDRASSDADPARVSIVAVAGGGGSPGRTSVALNLATALGAASPTVLVDADFGCPTVAAYLDRDPSRNVCTLAHALREDPHALGRALDEELQPLHPGIPSGVVLCGLPKLEMRSTVSAAALERLVGELAVRFRYVVLDVGAELLGLEPMPTLHRTALLVAQHVLVVAAPDLVGLWHARTVLGQLERHVEVARERTSLVLNRHDPRHHHAREEIEWHLGLPAVAVVPHDHAGMQRAIADQRPVVLDPSSRAGRALIELAERVHHGRLRLPASNDGNRHVEWWQVWRSGQSAGTRLPSTAGRNGSTPVSSDRGRGGPW